MNLRISGRKIAKWAIWSVVIILFLVFFIRVVTFEDNYYGSKEGSERAVTEDQSANVNTDLDEVEPTDAEVAEYTVAADRPRYLTIEKLGVEKSRVLAMSVNKTGELDTPRNIFDVGWYEGSSKPGQGGTMVIDGHNGGPHVHGVFKNLPNLTTGDIIQIERGDGAIFKYKVVENTSIDLNDSDAYMSTAMRSPETGIESVTLISCTGEWSQSQGTYLSRQFTRAILIDD